MHKKYTKYRFGALANRDRTSIMGILGYFLKRLIRYNFHENPPKIRAVLSILS